MLEWKRSKTIMAAVHRVGRRASRRDFLKSAALGCCIAARRAWGLQDAPRLPLRIGHRAASMRMLGPFEVFQIARQIPGLLGIELQVAGRSGLGDRETILRYRREAHRWGVMIPSLAGVWDQGVSIRSPEARANLLQAVEAGNLLGASVILVAFFRQNAPDMTVEASYAPVVELLQSAAPRAADAGITLGLENSLSPADNVKLVDLIDRPNVLVYYDVDNAAFYGYRDQAVPGIALLGKKRICQVHVKNEARLIEEPGRIDWAAAFRALNEIGYEGWYVFETQHTTRQQLIDATKKNIEFLSRHCRMPAA